MDWSDVRGLLSGGAETFHSIARPLSNFTELTYLTTSGGSYQEGHEERASDGWVKDRDLSKDKPNGGMRGLVFVTEVRYAIWGGLVQFVSWVHDPETIVFGAGVVRYRKICCHSQP